jgi:hypothetical protein
MSFVVCRDHYQLSGMNDDIGRAVYQMNESSASTSQRNELSSDRDK